MSPEDDARNPHVLMRNVIATKSKKKFEDDDEEGGANHLAASPLDIRLIPLME
jgi:hypothetical protein